MSLKHTVRSQSFYYDFTHRNDDLRSADATVSENRHQFRWDQTTRLFSPRLRLTTGYNFSRRRQTDRITGAETALRTIALGAGLHAEDGSPDLGTLDSVYALDDGNITDPVVPRIDIGQNSTAQNIGVDFGYVRSADALYIYTDRASGTTVSWDLFHSSDNLSWQRVTAGVADVFNTSSNRYEITFPVIRARYLKAVMGGINDVLIVLITEIEALEESHVGEETRSQVSHQVNATLRANLSDALQTGLDLHYRTEPSSDFGNSSDQFFYGASARHAPSRVFSHTVNYQAGWEDFPTNGDKLSSASMSYAMTVTPLQTLKFTLSGVSRNNATGGVREQETQSAQIRSTGKVLRDLDVSLDVGYSRAHQFLTNRRYDSWTYQTSIDAGLTRSLDAVVTYLYQTNREAITDYLRIRHQIAANLTLQLSRSVLLRGSLLRNEDDGREYSSQELSGVWRLSRRTSVSALSNFKESIEDARSRRHSIMVNHKLSAPTTLTLSYSETHSEGRNDRSTNSLQIGIRSGF
jgi:hypothetical protein